MSPVGPPFNLVKLNTNNEVESHWPNHDHVPEPGLMDVFGRTDGPDYMGRKYTAATDTFSPVIPPVPTKREQLRSKQSNQWTIEDLADWNKG